jgi:hypothetical protein
VQKQAEADF